MTEPRHTTERRARLPARARNEAGMTIVEVVVSALLVGLISLSLIGLEAVGRTTQDQRVRSQAVAVAQEDQERMRALTADQLTKLNQTRTVTVEGTAFTVVSTATFLAHSSGASSCSGAAADYAKVISSVTWGNNKRTPVVEQSVITPPAGGSFLAKAINQNGAAIPGVAMGVNGTDNLTDATSRSAVTDADGCAIFGDLTPGDYDVTAALTGYVDADGDATPTIAATATSGNTATTSFTLGQAGAVRASFTTVINSTTYTNQQAPSLSWSNPGMATPGTATPSSPAASIDTPKTLFPFITGGVGQYTGNYSLWAGRCGTAMPPPANVGIATVPPGADAAANATTIILPAMILGVEYRSSTSNPYNAVKPRAVRLTYPSPTGSTCGQNWLPPINTAAGPAAPSTGWLSLPGQPYGNGYTVCAEYRPSSTTYRGTATVDNTSYAAAGNPVTVQITGTSSNQGTC